jgi:hypothetical protein
VHWLFSFRQSPSPSDPTPLPSPRQAGRGEQSRTPCSCRQAGGRTAALLLLGALVMGGCAASKWTVKPHQRELLADRIMQLDSETQEREAEEHILSNREGAVGGTGTSGGGCGCN